MRVAGWVVLLGSLPLLCGTPGCQGLTGVVVSVVTDLHAPGELDEVSLIVTSGGAQVFSNQDDPWKLGPGQPDRLPGTLAFYAEGGEPTLELDVQGWQGGRMRVERKTRLTLVAGRTLLLRLALSRSCIPAAGGGSFREVCAAGFTCVEGKCGAETIDGQDLPSYSSTPGTTSGSGPGGEVVSCSGASTFVDTSTGQVVPASGSCASGQVCQEGSCLRVAGASDGGSDVPSDGFAADADGLADVASEGPLDRAPPADAPADVPGGGDGPRDGPPDLPATDACQLLPSGPADGGLRDAAQDAIDASLTSGSTSSLSFQTCQGPVCVATASPLPHALAAASDGNVWVAAASSSQLQRIDAAGTSTPFSGSTSGVGRLNALAASTAGGDLWAAGQTPSRLARVAVSAGQAGTVLGDFALPVEPDALTTTRDGRAWFSSRSGLIGWLSPAGDLTTFPVPGARSPSRAYLGLTEGPDGNVWFTDFYEHRLGRLTADGVFTFFAVPCDRADAYPTGIAAGPDGNLWFVATGVVGRLSPAGSLTRFALPAGSSTGPSIVAGPDGKLWFTEQNANRIASITTAGVLTEFAIPGPNSCQPAQLVAAADGKLWFSCAYSFGTSTPLLGQVTPP
jgi:streptogramin lyase